MSDYRRKVPFSERAVIRERVRRGELLKVLAAEYNVSLPCIHYIANYDSHADRQARAEKEQRAHVAPEPPVAESSFIRPPTRAQLMAGR